MIDILGLSVAVVLGIVIMGKLKNKINKMEMESGKDKEEPSSK